MKLRLRVLSGALAQQTLSLGPEPASVGRGPGCSLRFDAEQDRTVSARHALFYLEGGRWWLRDLGSTNGTYHNGRRILQPVTVSHGDRIAFGAGGPEVEVELPGVAAAEQRAEERDPARLLWIATAIVAILLAIIAFLLLSGRRERAAWEAERAVLVARMDSVLLSGEATIRSLRGEREGLVEALEAARGQLRETRASLDAAVREGDAQRVAELRRELQERTIALERQQLAATLDFDAIEAANRHAVAMIYVEDAAGGVSTASGFAVRPDATLITAAHALRGSDGSRQPRRIGVQFADSEQVFPGTIVAVSDDSDVAVIRATNIQGGVPVISGFDLRGDTLGSGAPVVVIGFPLGGAPEAPGPRARVARPLVSSGVISDWAEDQVEIEGYGAAGASGSPIFNAHGRVIAVLFGGTRRENGEAMVYGIPAQGVVRLLDTIR